MSITTRRFFSFLIMRTFKIYSCSNLHIHSTVLLAIVSMLYTMSPGLIYFVTGSLHLLTPFTHFAHPLPPTSGKRYYSQDLWVQFLFICFFFFKILSVSEIIQYVSLWLISLSGMPSRSICIIANGRISFYFMAE